jgi:hypothetical protein
MFNITTEHSCRYTKEEIEITFRGYLDRKKLEFLDCGRYNTQVPIFSKEAPLRVINIQEKVIRTSYQTSSFGS